MAIGGNLMANFNSLKNATILIHHHRQDKAESYLLFPNGLLHRLSWNKEATIDLNKLEKLWRVDRGTLYVIYESLGALLSKNLPPRYLHKDNDDYVELYVYEKGQCQHVEPLSGEPMPLFASYSGDLYLMGMNILDGILEAHDYEDPSRLGAGVLEAIFDIKIPNGFEALALTEIKAASRCNDDPDLMYDGEVFIKDLLHGEGLPSLSDALQELLLNNADIFRKHMCALEEKTTPEVAMVRGASLLWELEEKDTLYEYLSDLAEEEHSALACAILTDYLYKDNALDAAYHYACIGASLGHGPCCLFAAKLSDKKGYVDLARRYLYMGMHAGEADCFALMAAQIIRYAEEKEGHPFYYEDALEAAKQFAKEGVNRRSSSAMLFLAELLLNEGESKDEAYALQLLLRSLDLGEKKALYRLGEYYRKDHLGAEGKDLFLAETYIKKAIIENAYNLEDCQWSYALILLELHRDAKGMDLLLELAKKGYAKAKATLGKILVGVEPSCPKDEPLYVLEELSSLKENEEDFFASLLWRAYPDLLSPKEAAKALGKLAHKGVYLAFLELSKIHSEGPEELRSEEKANYFLQCYKKYRDKSFRAARKEESIEASKVKA